MDQNETPLFSRLLEHRKKSISFHVPGHKNGILLEGIASEFSRFMSLDVTELSGLDDLHDPQEVIHDAQLLLTDLYKTRKSYFLVNGSTVGNLAMILSVCKEGDAVLVQKNCHKSILNGLMMANVKPIFISPEAAKRNALPSRIAPDEVKRALEQYPNIKACIVTYPDYFGKTYDLEQISQFAHERNVVVLVDEAHGPHFQLGSPFPPSALQLGADIVVQSAHKMLPAMTMGSYLHINSDRVDSKKVEFYLAALQSSSPSYPIMASLDIARHYLAHFSKADIDYTLGKRQLLMDGLSNIPGIEVEQLESGQDPLKMIISHTNLTGYQLQTILENCEVYPEMADPTHVLLTLPLLKQGMEFPFEDAVRRIKSVNFPSGENQKISTITAGEKITKLALSYKEMFNKSVETISMNEAIGRVAAKMIISYPPGIPLLLQGEEITSSHLHLINEYLRVNARFQGNGEILGEGKLDVFEA